jgi:hypothetical protein
LQVRSFRVAGDSYRLILRSIADYSGRLAVCALGEDGAKSLVSVKRAWLDSEIGGAPVELPIAAGAIRELRIPGGKPVHVSVTVDTVDRLALTAVALREHT